MSGCPPAPSPISSIGVYRWSLYSDSATPTRFIETFVVESWAEQLRQHSRVTVGDKAAEDIARAFHVGATAPVISHLIYARAAVTKGYPGVV